MLSCKPSSVNLLTTGHRDASPVSKQRQGISASCSVGMKTGRVSISLHGLSAYLIVLAAQLASLLEEVDFPSAVYSYPFVSSFVLAQLTMKFYSGSK